MGRPLPGYRNVLLDGDDQPATEGEICVLLDPAPQGLMLCYEGDEEKTADVMRDGHYHTGDTALVDDDGYYFYVGRNDDALEIVRPLYELKKHVLTVNPLPRPVVLNGDATRLTQILSNLLNNAAKYTNRGGRVNLAARVEDKTLVLVVSDNGIGIAPEMLNSVFDMFVQVDSTLERTNAGLGVGLSLALCWLVSGASMKRLRSAGPCSSVSGLNKSETDM